MGLTPEGALIGLAVAVLASAALLAGSVLVWAERQTRAGNKRVQEESYRLNKRVQEESYRLDQIEKELWQRLETALNEERQARQAAERKIGYLTTGVTLLTIQLVEHGIAPIWVPDMKDNGRYPHASSDVDLAALMQRVEEHFDLVELGQVAIMSRLTLDQLKGGTIGEKARELVLHLHRRGRVQELMDNLRRLRPGVDWS